MTTSTAVFMIICGLFVQHTTSQLTEDPSTSYHIAKQEKTMKAREVTKTGNKFCLSLLLNEDQLKAELIRCCMEKKLSGAKSEEEESEKIFSSDPEDQEGIRKMARKQQHILARLRMLKFEEN